MKNQNSIEVIQINSVDHGSTGNIAINICKSAERSGIRSFLLVPCFKKNDSKDNHVISFGSSVMRAIAWNLERWIGYHDVLCFHNSRSLISFLKKTKPRIVHLHNLHDSFLNLPSVFSFFKKNKIKLIWTLHDCWSFTGRCPYFTALKCQQWENGCQKCLYPKNKYPTTKIDKAKAMWKLKKKWFSCLPNLTIVSPSNWLSELVQKSFLNHYPIRVINNGIDLDVFKPTESFFRQKYNLVNKNIVLGVAFEWGVRKGLDVFIELSHRLGDEYQIILVGTNDIIDETLPENIISIHSTKNQLELAEIYSAADLFINPTREDNFPTVNIESLACGTPVLTFKTGGSIEIIDDTCGSYVECEDIDAFENKIKYICEKKPYSRNACLKRSKMFDMKNKFQEYIELYKEILSNG